MAGGDVSKKNVEEDTADNVSHKKEEEFTVKRKRTASAVENMEQEECCEAKRPNFPPLSGQSLTSVSYYLNMVSLFIV